MARYVNTIRSARSQTDAFDFMADLRNFEQWDPGVRQVTQITGDGGGADADFDVVVDAPRGGLTLRYHTPIHEPPNRVVVRARSRLFTSIDTITVQADGQSSINLIGRTIVVTGATSGLDRHAAQRFAAAGATVVIAGRDRAKADRVKAEISAETGSKTIDIAIADMGELDQVRNLAEALRAKHERIDVLVHNAGALSAERGTTSDGFEATVASQVLGPFLLTSLLVDRLAAAAPGRVIAISSGGMYATGLTTDHLQMEQHEYRGTEQYARAKRAQVTLNEAMGPTSSERRSRVPGDAPWVGRHPWSQDIPTDIPQDHRAFAPISRAGRRHHGVARR